MALRFEVREFNEVASTNDVVKELASAGEPEGVVVCARSQTAGYGRRGNAWESEPGGLYMSLLLRPESEAAQVQTLPLIGAIAVRRALASFLPERAADIVQVKWPNDVVMSQSAWHFDSSLGSSEGLEARSSFNKICGISSEVKQGAICVGIGVNVLGREDAAQAAVDDVERNSPTYLSEFFASGECPSVDRIRDEVLEQFAGIYKRWQEFGFAPFRNEYMQHFALMGATVRIEDAFAFVGDGGMPVREVPCCVLKGIDDEGHLIATACGSVEAVRVTAGRVHLLHGE